MIGRQVEIARISDMIRRDEVRLVTLTGPGGIGKTRLAIAVAAALRETQSHEPCLVSLAPVTDPNDVSDAIGRALGLRDPSLLKQYLRERTMLLILDNFEHVLPAAPLVSDLLVTCPGVKVLATSRASLHISGEHELPVPPLTAPPPAAARTMPIEELMESPALKLFAERARATQPRFALTPANAGTVAALCLRLDGLALAIELAATRVKTLPPHEILARLDHSLTLLTNGPRDLPARQQTLRATIRWSFDLLSELEQVLFRRLAVFVSGCTLDAIQAVCGADGDDDICLLDHLTTLVEHNLLTQQPGFDDQPRFAMLETIREFGLEQLTAHGEAGATQAKYAAWFHALARQSEAGAYSAAYGHWMRVLTADQDNLRAVFRWTLSGGDVTLGLDTAAALQVWFVSNALQEGRTWLERLLATPVAGESIRIRARAMRVFGWLIFAQTNLASARAVLTESIALWRNVADPRELALALAIFAVSALDLPDQTAAIAAATEAVALGLEVDDPVATHFGYINLGNLALVRGDMTAAWSAFEQAAGFARVTGSQPLLAGSLANLARVDVARGNLDRAVDGLTEALNLLRSIGPHAQQGWLMTGQYLTLGEVHLRRGDLVAAAAAFREAVGIGAQTGALRDTLLAIDGLGRVAAGQEDWNRAAWLMLAVDRLANEYGAARQTGVHGSPNKAQRETVVAQIRSALGEPEFLQIANGVSRVPLNQVVDDAMSDETGAPAGAGP